VDIGAFFGVSAIYLALEVFVFVALEWGLPSEEQSDKEKEKT